MSSETDIGDFYKSGTASSADKLVKKYKGKVSVAVEKLQDPEVQDAWHANVSADKAKKHFAAGVNDLNPTEMATAMEQKGKSAYTRATQLDSTVQKYLKNSKPYRDVATQFSKEKKVITSDADREFNMLENMRRQMAKKEELSS